MRGWPDHRAFPSGRIRIRSGTHRHGLPGTDCGLPAEGGSGPELGRDVVLGPAEDGGYVLIGMGQPHSTLFSTIDWGTDRVMAQTLEAIGACGLSYQLLDTLWDVDRPEDLQRLRLLNPPLDWDGDRKGLVT